MKFQRAFWMQVQGASRTWTFQSPLTLELEVERGIWQSVSEGVFRIYNLAQSTRSDIYQDWLDQGDFRQITIRAGYRSWATSPGGINVNATASIQSLPVIFTGNIKQAYSQREGPSWVTTISAWDGGFGITQGDINTSLAPGVSLTQIVQQLISAMPNLDIGFVDSSLSTENLRGISLVGPPWEKLSQIAQALYADLFIDLGKVYLVAKGSSIPGLTGLGLISPAQGLLETPMKQRFIVSFNMLFEPRLKVGQSVTLQSLETVNNGTYTVVGISHHGTISDAVAGDMRTKVSCFYPQGAQPSGAIH